MAVLGVLGVLGGMVLPAEAEEASPRIAEFSGDRAGALSYTLDDGLREQFTMALPMLDALKLRATFFIVSGLVTATPEEAAAKKPGAFGAVTWDQLRAVAAGGHEIGNHTWSHIGLTALEEEKAVEEIEKGAQKIAEEIGVYPCSFCYPGNGSNVKIRELVMRNHCAAREFQTSVGKADVTPVRLNEWADGLIAKRKWGVAMVHGITVGYDPIAPEVLEAHLKYAHGLQQGLWIDTFGRISCYIQQRKAATLKVVSQSPGKVTFVLETPPLRLTYKMPLTVVLPANGATSASAKTASGKTLHASVVSDGVQIECLPGPEEIMAAWQ